MMEVARLVVIKSPKYVTPITVCRTERAALENMCVIGDVTRMLSNPAMHNRNPKNPVTRVPHKNTVASQCGSDIMVRKVKGSPHKMTNGRRITAEPKFVHHASCIVELLQCGRDILISTA